MPLNRPGRTIPVWEKRGFANANDYCADLLYNNPNIRIPEAIQLTGATIAENSMWRKVDRLKKKKAAATAGKKAPPIVNITSSALSNVSDISAPTASSSSSSSNKRTINGRVDILDLRIPTFKPPDPLPEDVTAQAEQLVKEGALSKAGMSFKVGAHVITADKVVLAAQIQQERYKQKQLDKELKATAKEDSLEADANAAFQIWRNGGQMFKMDGKDAGQPDMDAKQLKKILHYLLKKGGTNETISMYDKNRGTMWKRICKFGENGEPNWIARMKELNSHYWATASAEVLLKQPPLFGDLPAASEDGNDDMIGAGV